MKYSKILDQLKEIAGDMIDNNGNFRTIPTGMVGKRNLSNDRLSLLQSLLVLLRDTDIITKETKLYIFERYITIKGVNDKINDRIREVGGNDSKLICYNTTSSRIGYDRGKIVKEFGNSIIADIVTLTGNDEILNQHRKNIAQAYIRYGNTEGKDIRDNLALKLDRGCLCTELEEDKFKQFIETIQPYLKSQMDYISSIIDKDSVGYFNYLLFSPVLTEVDKRRLEELKQRLDTSNIIVEQLDIE